MEVRQGGDRVERWTERGWRSTRRPRAPPRLRSWGNVTELGRHKWDWWDPELNCWTVTADWFFETRHNTAE